MVRSRGGDLMGDIIKRHGGYTLRFYEGGKRRTLASHQTSYADARRMLLEIEARVARGEAGIVERKAEPLTVAELAERFLAEYSRPRIKDIDRYRYGARMSLNRVVPLLKGRADQVTSGDVAKAREVLRRGCAPATARLSLNYLATVFSWAVKEKLLEKSPCVGVERPQAEGSLDFLSKEEIRRLLDAVDAAAALDGAGRMLRVAVQFALYTGMRKGELLGLRWIDLDLETRRLTVARSYKRAPKGNKPRHLRLPALLIPLLHEWKKECPRSSDGVLLPAGKQGGAMSGQAMLGLPKVWRAAGLREVAHPFHILRHSFASHYVMAGGNILALQKILGHASIEMTLVYAHLAPDFLEGELDRLKF
ncbi:MAG: site-specific integrase [Myxococcales bacterium]|nr:site-specific integrase [Myxococcales bacterium]